MPLLVVTSGTTMAVGLDQAEQAPARERISYRPGQQGPEVLIA